jgi:hypothetical protein
MRDSFDGGSKASSTGLSDQTTTPTLRGTEHPPYSIASGISMTIRRSIDPTRLDSQLYGTEEENYAQKVREQKASERELPRK